MQNTRDRFIESVEQHKFSVAAIYDDLDKKFGSTSPETLENLAALLETTGQTDDQERAASALLEAAVFRPRSIDTIDETLDGIDYAQMLLKKVVYDRWDNALQNATGETYELALRAETHLAYIEMYKDIVCGEITQQTRDEIFVVLGWVGRQASNHPDRADSWELAGLEGETAALMGGLADPHTILLPATPRENSGNYGDGSMTHDFNHITLGPDGRITQSIGIEFKRLANEMDRARAERRYDRSRIVLIHAQDIGINPKSLHQIFSNFELTAEAHHDLTPVREGINRHVEEAISSWQDSGLKKSGPPHTQDSRRPPKKTA